jgi:hypothetical protein
MRMMLKLDMYARERPPTVFSTTIKLLSFVAHLKDVEVSNLSFKL